MLTTDIGVFLRLDVQPAETTANERLQHENDFINNVNRFSHSQRNRRPYVTAV